MVNVSQVAEAAGVSLATASRVLRNPSNLRTANQRRVMDAAQRLGYRFDTFGGAGATRQILFLSFSNVLSAETFFNGAYSSVVGGINRVIGPAGYNLLVHHVERDGTPPPCLLRGEVDGVLFHGQMSRAFHDRYVKELPMVGLQHFDPEYDCSWVKIDNRELAFQAVKLLKEAGHRRIGFVSDERDCFHSRERYQGYREALLHFGLEFRDEWAIQWQRPFENGELPNSSESPEEKKCFARAFAGAAAAPSALYCLDTSRAVIAERNLREHNLTIPGDVSVAASGSDKFGRDWTLFNDRFDDVCAEGARLLLDTISGRRCECITELIRPRFRGGSTILPFHGKEHHE